METPEERAWEIVRRAFDERTPPRARRRRGRVVAGVAAVVLAAVIGAALSSPGRAVFQRVREAVGVEHAAPAIVSLPGGGRLLVVSAERGGVWVVEPDGLKRRLGTYADAEWSPHGLYVVATKGNELVALDPQGHVHWTLARLEPSWPRWEGTLTDTRIAYLAASGLRVVAGDGTGDHRFGPAAAVAPAWRPDGAHVLAYVDRRDHVRVVDVDSGRQLWRSAQVGGPIELAWSPDSRRLVVATTGGWRLFSASGLVLARRSEFGLADVAWAPRGRRIALVSSSSDGSSVLLADPAGHGRIRELFSGPGRFGRLAFSPDGRRLLVPWLDADQWLFVSPSRGGHVGAVANIGRQFARGGRGGAFPDSVEWCCGG